MRNETEKVLIIRLGAIGDVVHTTNLYRSIKLAYPQTEIHYLTTKPQSCFLENDKDIDKVICIKKEDLNLKNAPKLAHKLKNENYTLVINLHPNFKTRFLVFLAGIKKQAIYKKSYKIHAVENFFQTGKTYFPKINLQSTMKLCLSKSATEYATETLANLPKPIIAINAGGINSPRQGRTYPVEKWIELGKALQDQTNGTIILTGASEDIQALSPLNQIPNSISFIGKTTLEQNAALISECSLMISGDSGPLHIATALNVPAIGLYGAMPINRTGTYGTNCLSLKSNMECVPCNRRKCKFIKHTNKIYTPCMEAINVEEILKKALMLLNR